MDLSEAALLCLALSETTLLTLTLDDVASLEWCVNHLDVFGLFVDAGVLNLILLKPLSLLPLLLRPTDYVLDRYRS